MSIISVEYKAKSTKFLERTGWTHTIRLALPNGTSMDQLLMSKKHGDLALHIGNERIPVRLDRITSVEASIATVFVQHDKFEKVGTSSDELMNGDLKLEFDVQTALFSPDEMNAKPGVKASSAPSADEADEDTSEDESEAETTPKPKRPRKPRGEAGRGVTA
jgi:hypothetical protein